VFAAATSLRGVGSLTGLALSLLFTAALFYVLYLVVRAAVRDGMRQALRMDLLREVDKAAEGPGPPRGPRAFREAQERD
jgi:hypothetical protein